MPVDLPGAFQEGLIDDFSQNTWLTLCQIAVPTQDTQYHAKNNASVTYAGDEYTKSNLEIGARSVVSDGSMPTMTLRISALNSTLYNMIQSVENMTGTTVKIITVNNDQLVDAIPALEADFEAITNSSDEDWVYFTLGIDNPMDQGIPLRVYNSAQCPYAVPALFKGSRCQYAGLDVDCEGTLQACKDKSNQTHWGGWTGLDQASMVV